MPDVTLTVPLEAVDPSAFGKKLDYFVFVGQLEDQGVLASSDWKKVRIPKIKK